MVSYEKITAYTYADSLMLTERSTNSTLQYLHPTLAFQWESKNQNFNEVELINFYINKNRRVREQLDSLGRVETILSTKILHSSAISFRYEYIVNFRKSKSSRFAPSLGYSGNPYFESEQFVPEKANEFKNGQITIGGRVSVIPRLIYYLGARFYIDLNLPICVMDMNYRMYQNENPSIPDNQRRISNFNFELFPKVLAARIGVGLKL